MPIQKYRKLPVEIEAIQFDGTNSAVIECWSGDQVKQSFDYGLAIKTLEGTMKALTGDYIIKGVQGEFYPCKPDIFAKTYEAVE